MYISLQPTPTWSQKVTLLARTTQNLSWHRQQAVCGSRSNAEQSTLDNQRVSGMRQHRVGGGICSCCLEDSARCNRSIFSKQAAKWNIHFEKQGYTESGRTSGPVCMDVTK